MLAAAAALAAAGGASARQDQRLFYLQVHARQCAIAPARLGAKTMTVVACSNPAHNLEVFAIDRGGWGDRTPSFAFAASRARAVCFASYQRLTHHGPPRTAGWEFLFADPGAEAARYGDKVVCGFRSWPQLEPLGSGWHVR
jgi:hypothetical protein